MEIFKKLRLKLVINVLKELTKVNLFSTIWLNFKHLPFRLAYRLPILFYGKVKFEEISGKINIVSSTIKFGMIRFGGNHERVTYSKNPTYLLIRGVINFQGNAKFGKGIRLVVWDNGEVSFGSDFSLGSDSHIVSFRKVIFGKNCLISWNCSFFDTDFHFIKDIKSMNVSDNCSPIHIGDFTWIGFHVTALKGTILPNNIIIGAQSVLAGNYMQKVAENSIIGGNPAKTIKSGYRYIFGPSEERVFFKKFMSKV